MKISWLLIVILAGVLTFASSTSAVRVLGSAGEFKVMGASAFHGFTHVRDKVKFEFDIVGR